MTEWQAGETKVLVGPADNPRLVGLRRTLDHLVLASSASSWMRGGAPSTATASLDALGEWLDGVAAAPAGNSPVLHLFGRPNGEAAPLRHTTWAGETAVRHLSSLSTLLPAPKADAIVAVRLRLPRLAPENVVTVDCGLSPSSWTATRRAILHNLSHLRREEPEVLDLSAVDALDVWCTATLAGGGRLTQRSRFGPAGLASSSSPNFLVGRVESPSFAGAAVIRSDDTGTLGAPRGPLFLLADEISGRFNESLGGRVPPRRDQSVAVVELLSSRAGELARQAWVPCSWEWREDTARESRPSLILDSTALTTELGDVRDPRFCRITVITPDDRLFCFLVGCGKSGLALANRLQIAGKLLARAADGPLLVCAGTTTDQQVVAAVDIVRATTRTVERANRILAEIPQGPSGRTGERLGSVITRLRQVPTEPLHRASWLRGVRAEQLAKAGITGHLALAALAIDECVFERAEPEQFADAANAFMRYLCSYPATLPAAVSNLLHLTNEFVLNRPERPWLDGRVALAVDDYDAAVRERLYRILAVAPWLRWFLDSIDLSSIPSVRLTLVDALHMFALLRPRLRFRRGPRWSRFNITERYVPMVGARAALVSQCFNLPDELAQLCQQAETGDRTLDQLVGNLEHLYRDVYDCRRLTLHMALPPALEKACLHLFDAVGARRTVQASDLIVLADWAGGDACHLVVVSQAGDDVLPVEAENTSCVLRPMALDLEQDSVAFASEIHDADVREGFRVRVLDRQYTLRFDPRRQLHAPAGPTTTNLDDALFTGRRSELIAVGDVLASAGPDRSGALIHGVRRAGKTTLAKRSCEIARRAGSVTWWTELDLYGCADLPDRQDYRLYRQALCRVMEMELAALGVAAEPCPADPVLLLQTIDRRLDSRIAIVLDELDFLINQPSGSGFRELAGRLGSVRLHNISLVGTVQRFHASSVEFRGWRNVACSPDLTWGDGIRYFLPDGVSTAPGDTSLDVPRTVTLDRPGVSPQTYLRVVQARLACRPYFWGQLMQHLTSTSQQLGTALLNAATVHALIDEIGLNEQHLRNSLAGTAGLPPDEIRQRDLFSEDERRIVALFARLEVGKDSIGRARAVQTGGEAAVSELLNRAFLVPKQEKNQLALAVPLYGDVVRWFRHELPDL